MKRKLIISENQYKKLKGSLNEGELSEIMVKEISADLDANYQRVMETYREDNEYRTRKAFQNETDGELISPANLLEYLKMKYEDVNEDFLKQVMNDWTDRNIKDGRLSKNISPR